MRRVSLIGLALVIPAVLFAADLFSTLGWDQATFEDTCFQFAQAPEKLPPFPVTPAMRALSITNRKEAILAIGAKAKAYYASETFKKRWADYALPSYAKVEQEASAKAQGEQQKNQALAQMEAILPMLPPAQQEQVKAQIAKEKAKETKKKQSDTDTSNFPPKDPKVAIKKALQTLLAATDGIDYAAATEQRETKRYFTNPVYEAKPEAWKMAFRAGREASEGARTYVKDWLTGLK
jgi:hypothetical protein